MKVLWRAVTNGGLLFLLSLFLVKESWASDFEDKVERVFSSSVIESIKQSGSKGEVVLKVPERMPDYFETGDKADKVFAIESVRIFRDVSDLERLILNVPKAEGVQVLDVSRSDVESFYRISLSEMKDDPGYWRSKFIQVYDNAESRAAFAKRFVVKK